MTGMQKFGTYELFRTGPSPSVPKGFGTEAVHWHYYVLRLASSFRDDDLSLIPFGPVIGDEPALVLPETDHF